MFGLVLILILKILLYLLVFIIGLSLLFFIVPFEYEFSTKIDEKIKADVSLAFFEKFLKVMISYEDKETSFIIKVMGLCIIKKKLKKPNVKRKKEKVSKKKYKFDIMDYIQGEFIKDLINYFKDILDIIKPKTIKINGIYGFEDPSLTGMVCGIIPLIAKLIPRSDINLQPVFDNEIIDIYGEIYGRISLVVATIKTLKFVLKKNNRKRIFKKLKKAETY